MTDALVVLGLVVVGILWSAWLWRVVTSGEARRQGGPRHVESDWGSPTLPTTSYSRMPRLP